MLRCLIVMFFCLSVGAFASGSDWKVVRSSATISSANTVSLHARKAIDKDSSQLRTEDGETHRIVVKFKDDAFARANVAKRELKIAASVQDLASVTEQQSISYEPLLKKTERELDELQQLAASRSGRAQPDFAGILVANLPDNGASATLEAARALEALDCVEYVEIRITSKLPPPPEDYAPTTADLTSHQDYFGTDPGLDVDYAWSVGAKGAGIRLSDIEYKAVTNHEDLVDANIEEPNATSNMGGSEHGTASLGVTLAVDNGYGMTGIAPDASGAFYTEHNGRENALIDAVADSSVGDVILLEMQATGDGAYVPAEYVPTLWTVIKNATDAGMIIVGAAGNGGENLDDSFYDAYNARGDSGAIIVGAGPDYWDHFRSYFSTYGSRVNVQGWGQGVATLGYGDLALYGSDTNKQSYTQNWGGTSSASAMIAGVCVALQSYCEANFSFRLTCEQMRQLLIDTGIPQSASDADEHIGPFPNMRAAIEKMDEDYEGYWFLVPTVSELSIPEGGTAQFGLKLNRQPTNSVTVTVAVTAGDSDFTVVSGSTLNFTTATWDSNQWVTVQAAEDDDWTNGSATVSCSLSNPISVEDIALSEQDNDLDPTYSLPFAETFENSGANAGALGDLNGQHGWISDSTGSVVASTIAHYGIQSCSVKNSSIQHEFVDGGTNVWITFYAINQDVITEQTPMTRNDAARFHLGDNRHIVAYSNELPVVNTNITVPLGTWHKFSVHCDYVDRRWDLYVDDNIAFSNLAFGVDAPAVFTSIEVTLPKTNNMLYYDDFDIRQNERPVEDSDVDGIPDWWEVSHFTNGAYAEQDADSDGDKIDNYSEWIALTDPTNASSYFAVTDVSYTNGSAVIHWQGRNSRKYGVWRSSNLNSNFSEIASDLWGNEGENVYTDSVHTIEQPSFYRLEVSFP